MKTIHLKISNRTERNKMSTLNTTQHYGYLIILLRGRSLNSNFVIIKTALHFKMKKPILNGLFSAYFKFDLNSVQLSTNY